MKTFASTAAIIGALAFSVCSSASAALPAQFKVKTWKLGECEGVASYFGTGLYAGDKIEIEESSAGGAVKTGVATNNNRRPNPNDVNNAKLVLVGPNPARENVLTQSEVQSLCAAWPEEFEEVFWSLLVKRKFDLTYLAGDAVLHGEESTLVIFLPYALTAGGPARFILAVVPRGHHAHQDMELTSLSTEQVVAILKKKKNHNGIVHGSP